jgi:hypothetical protein
VALGSHFWLRCVLLFKERGTGALWNRWLISSLARKGATSPLSEALFGPRR